MKQYNFCFSVNQAFLRGLKQSVIPDTVREEQSQKIEEPDCISCVLPISSKSNLDNDKCVNVTARSAEYAWNTYGEHLTELPRLCSCNLNLTDLVLLFIRPFCYSYFSRELYKVIEKHYTPTVKVKEARNTFIYFIF